MHAQLEFESSREKVKIWPALDGYCIYLVDTDVFYNVRHEEVLGDAFNPRRILNQMRAARSLMEPRPAIYGDSALNRRQSVMLHAVKLMVGASRARKRTKQPEGEVPLERTSMRLKDLARKVPEPIVVLAKVNGHQIRALLDTGSMADFLSTTLVDVIALTFSHSFRFQVPPFSLTISYDFTTLSLFLYPVTIHSLLFLLFSPFHTSQEQDETAHGLLLTIHYWYMRIGIAIVRRTFADSVDPPDAPHTNSGASSSPHSHDGLSDGPGPKEERSRSPSSFDRGTDISRVQPSPSEEPLQRFSMSRAERSTLLSRHWGQGYLETGDYMLST